ncbi:MAG: ABC transporter permease [Tannerellaceae bacterium]
MIKQYIQQVFYSIRQQKLLSGITIAATALTICLVMFIVMLQQVRTMSFAPESNRDKTLYVRWVSVSDNGRIEDTSNSPMGCKVVDHFKRVLNVPEEITFLNYYPFPVSILEPGSNRGMMADIKYTDDAYFRVFDFQFIKGEAFNKDQYDAKAQVAVVSKDVANEMFESIDIIGNIIDVNHIPYRIVGVVDNVSTITPWAYGQIWLSFDVDNFLWDTSGFTGEFSLAMKLKSANNINKARQEFNTAVAEYNKELAPYKLFFRDQPDDINTANERIWANVIPDMKQIRIEYYLTILILLLIPAVNLGAMSQGLLRQRIAEIGVRRAFGAKESSIILQLINENLILVLISGLFGFMLSVCMVLLFGSTFFSSMTISQSGALMDQINLVMILRPQIFVLTLLFCFVLNLLSCGIPAWIACKRNIVYALHYK